MNAIDILMCVLMTAGLTIFFIAIIGRKTKSSACDNCNADKGYCMMCSQYPTNRGLFSTIKEIFQSFKI